MKSFLAIFGIDGSGKSALAQELIRQSSGSEAVQILTCPRYHHTPGAPFSDLSEIFEEMNSMGDRVTNLEWKAAAVYLQLTLYGRVKEGLLTKSGADILVSERHPLIDSLVYGPFFAQKIEKNLDLHTLENRFWPTLEGFRSGSRAQVENWLRGENERLGCVIEFAELPMMLKALYARDPGTLLNALSHHFGTGLPNVAILLDIEIDLALERIAKRSGKAELHENRKSLESLRAGYERAFTWLAQAHPEVRVVRLKVAPEKAISEMADEVRQSIEKEKV